MRTSPGTRNMAKLAAVEYWIKTEDEPSDTLDRLVQEAELERGRTYGLRISSDPKEDNVTLSLL